MYNKIYKSILYNFDDNQLIELILSSFVESEASLKFIEMAISHVKNSANIEYILK